MAMPKIAEIVYGAPKKMEGPEDAIKRKQTAMLTQRRGNVQGLRDKLTAMKGPDPMALEKAPEMGDFKSAGYDALRARTESRIRGGQQEAGDAMARRFASIGSLNSGAAIKAQANQDQAFVREREEQLQEVDFQENQQATGRFDAAREQSNARNLSREMSNADRAFQTEVFKFQAGSSLEQMDMAIDELEENLGNSSFNRQVARHDAKNSGGLFGGGGFLGLGIGQTDPEF